MELGFISREKENIILISTACDLKAGKVRRIRTFKIKSVSFLMM